MYLPRRCLLLVLGVVVPGDEPVPAVASVTPSIEPDDRTSLLILATPHLEAVPGFEPALLDELREWLRDLAPDVICVETLPGREVEWMQAGGEAYAPVVEQFTDGLEWCREARERRAVSRSAAEDWLWTSDRSWDPARTPRDPAALRERLDHCLAAGDVPSAVLQWAYLREVGDSVVRPGGEALSRFLDQQLQRASEVYALALPLARELEHCRLAAVDSHLDKDHYLRIAPALTQELAGTEAAEAGAAGVYRKTEEMTRSCVESGSLLPLYRWLNSASYAREDVLAQWDVFLRTQLPSGLDRTRLALWDVRNYGIASHIRRVTAAHPGGTVLVIIGAAHKPFLEAILRPMLDLRLVAFE